MTDQRIESTLRDVGIESVSTRTVGQNNSTIWDIQTIGGPKLSTFKAPLGNAAAAIHENGQLADMKVVIEQKDQYTNYILMQIQVSKASVTTPVGQAAVAAQDAQGVSFERFAKEEQEKRAHQDATEALRNLSIHRQVAAKVAAALNSDTTTANDFWQNVRAMVEFFQTGITPFDLQKPAEGSVTSHTAEPSLPTFSGAQEQDDGDGIPF